MALISVRSYVAAAGPLDRERDGQRPLTMCSAVTVFEAFRIRERLPVLRRLTRDGLLWTASPTPIDPTKPTFLQHLTGPATCIGLPASETIYQTGCSETEVVTMSGERCLFEDRGDQRGGFAGHSPAEDPAGEDVDAERGRAESRQHPGGVKSATHSPIRPRRCRPCSSDQIRVKGAVVSRPAACQSVRVP